MEAKNYALTEVELDAIDAKEIITELLNAQLSAYRIKSLQDWEKNHKEKSKWEDQIENQRFKS